ncbi:type II secretion system minor pseudopilin GspI [Candidatus Marimicrobium litorale]|nr:type II secretion system minor pseudopilin GspI [Candidatus Marimicrobium litorale]
MNSRGFTLVEVMVALAIVAIALPAVLMALSQQMNDTAYLRDKTIAQMVAANKLNEMRLVIGASGNLVAGKDNGVSPMAGRDWRWWQETKATPMDKFYRIEINVAPEGEQDDDPVYTLTAFMTSDLETDVEELPSQEGDQPPLEAS